MIRSRKAFQTGVLHSRSGATAVIFVISLAGSWRSSFPVCRSTMPAGVFSSHGSASHTSLLAANRRSALASFSIAEIVLAVVIPRRGFSVAVFLGCRSATFSREIECEQRFFRFPARAIPFVPCRLGCDVAKLVLVLLGESQGERVLGERIAHVRCTVAPLLVHQL